jgi:hypothetical protein
MCKDTLEIIPSPLPVHFLVSAGKWGLIKRSVSAHSRGGESDESGIRTLKTLAGK